MPCSSRTPYGTALYVKENVDVLSESVRCNYNDVEITLLRLNQPIHNLNIVEIYRSKSKVKISKFIEALKNLFLAAINDPNVPVIIIGDFNINFMENASDKKSLCKYLIEENKFTQLIHEVTTWHATFTLFKGILINFVVFFIAFFVSNGTHSFQIKQFSDLFQHLHRFMGLLRNTKNV